MKKKWTLFWDMHSGGGTKEGYFDKIYIEAPEDEAKVIFYNRFGHNPERVSCTCCGDDYSISESDSLEEASAYHRKCEYIYRRTDGSICEQSEAWVPLKGIKKGYEGGYEETEKSIPLKEYLKQKNVKVIYAKDIKRNERSGEVPSQGYVWQE